MSETKIHPTAIIAATAELGVGVEIGPFCVVGANVKLGDHCKLLSHVVLDGHLSVESENLFYQFCSIGAPPQDTSYKGEPTRVEIGRKNIFREYVSVHRGTTKQDYVTIIGSENLFMAYVHIGHDVVFGNNCVVANSVNFAGHVKIGDRCVLGGGSQVSQYVTIGRGCYIAGATGLDRDVPLYCTALGNRAKLKGINIIGMRRQGHSKQVITEVVDFYRSMEASAFSPRSFIEHPELMEEFKNNTVIEEMVQSIRTSEVGIASFAG